MEGKLIVITSSDQLSSIDGDIIDCLSYGIDIHILKTSHMVCESDNVLFHKYRKEIKEVFHKYSRNNDTSSRVIFIDVDMEHDIKEMEEFYYKESRRTMHPCPSDPYQMFKWFCPVCYKDFHNM